MANKIINSCPVCGRTLHVSKLTCHSCHIDISGDFELSGFANKHKEELQFISAFVRVQGNIKEMERVFGVSYPTIKKMLENITIKLGGNISTSNNIQENNDNLLEQIKKGEINVDDAIKKMKGR